MVNYIIISVITLLVLIFDKSIGVNFLRSYIFDDEFDEKNKWLIYIIYSILSPITLTKIILIKLKTINFQTINFQMNFMKNIIYILLIIGTIYGVSQIVKSGIGYYNQSVNYELTFKQKFDNRLALIDKITRVIHQKLQLSKINDSAYYKNLYVIALARQDNKNLFMKWVTENNPNTNYNEVSAMYKDVSASIESERNNLQSIESELAQTVFEYTKLHKEIPSKFFLFYQPTTLSYTPISTTYNRIVNQTGIDDKIDIQ